ncbi:MAG: phage head closure protein [Lachnospiraceae bacterium]|nr:phage head closure protein [Lachnospiraceae bacterium]
MNVNPGELNKKIQIVRIEKKNFKGGFASEKENEVIRDTWAKVTRVSATEVMKAEREINVTRCRFLIRYSPAEITHSMFVLYAGTYYQIEYANNYGDSNEYIEIMATAGGA